MRKWFSRMIDKLLYWLRSGNAERDFNRAVELVPAALPIVGRIAEATPTRSDDELVALAKQEGLPYVEQYLSVAAGSRGMALLQIATDILARVAPGTPTRILNTAAQLAYTGWKASH